MDRTTNPFTGPLDEPDATLDGVKEAFLALSGGDLLPIRLPVITIGRRIDNTLVLNDPRVSRVHAELRCVRGHFVIFDRQSSGGTYVNGVRVSHSVLYDGDVISLAGVQMIFRQANLPRPDLNKTESF